MQINHILENLNLTDTEQRSIRMEFLNLHSRMENAVLKMVDDERETNARRAVLKFRRKLLHKMKDAI